MKKSNDRPVKVFKYLSENQDTYELVAEASTLELAELMLFSSHWFKVHCNFAIYFKHNEKPTSKVGQRYVEDAASGKYKIDSVGILLELVMREEDDSAVIVTPNGEPVCFPGVQLREEYQPMGKD